MSITLKVETWNNDLAIRIPKTVADQCGITEGSSITMEARPGRSVIFWQKYKLDELASQITPENRHPETDWEEPQGEEVW